jgi:hypothetical protein
VLPKKGIAHTRITARSIFQHTVPYQPDPMANPVASNLSLFFGFTNLASVLGLNRVHINPGGAKPGTEPTEEEEN